MNSNSSDRDRRHTSTQSAKRKCAVLSPSVCRRAGRVCWLIIVASQSALPSLIVPMIQSAKHPLPATITNYLSTRRFNSPSSTMVPQSLAKATTAALLPCAGYLHVLKLSGTDHYNRTRQFDGFPYGISSRLVSPHQRHSRIEVIKK